MIKRFIRFFTLFTFSNAFAQNIGTISGLILDQSTGEPLTGANIVLLDTRLGAASDLNGEYQILKIPPGEYTLRASMLGYSSLENKTIILPGESAKIDFNLLPSTLQAVPDVVIAAEKLVEGASVSDVALNPRMFQSKDGLMEDPIKVLQTLPGIASSGDPFSPGQLYVRGGAPEENLFLLDWAKVYFPWFLGGTKSVFNSQLIADIELLTGGFPPKYGNCLSSVLSVTTRDGNREKYAGGFTLGVMTTQGLFEGPINGNSSFLITARRTYLDLIMGEQEDYPIPGFYDYNLKIKYDLNEKHNLDFTAFSSHEQEEFSSDNPDPGVPPMMDIDMQANTQTLELNSVLSPHLYSKTALTHSLIESRVLAGTIYNVHSLPELLALRQDLTYKPLPDHEFKAGYEFSYNDYLMESSMPIDPSDTYTSWDTTGMPVDFYDFTGQYYLAGFYLQDSYTIIKPLTFTGGFRFDYDFDYENLDLLPRLSARYQINPKTAVRAAWGDYRMFKDRMFMQDNPALPSDRALHYILGLDHDFDNSFSGWMEIYYKDYSHIITADSTGVFTANGAGYAKGIELFLQKKLGAFTGWVNYSLSEAKRKEYLDTELNYFDYDQRHISSLTMEYDFPQPQSYLPDVITLNFRFYTGRPYTPTIAGIADQYGNYYPVKGEINSRRYSDFHALGLRCEWQFPLLKTAQGKFYLEGWNLYDRKNQMGVNYEVGSQYPDGVLEKPYYSTPLLIGGGLGITF